MSHNKFHFSDTDLHVADLKVGGVCYHHVSYLDIFDRWLRFETSSNQQYPLADGGSTSARDTGNLVKAEQIVLLGQ